MTTDDFKSIGNEAMKVIKELVNKKPLSPININNEGGNWEVLVEVLERAAVPDTQNLIGIYKVMFDKNKKLLSYKRVQVRRKGDIGSEEPEIEAK